MAVQRTQVIAMMAVAAAALTGCGASLNDTIKADAAFKGDAPAGPVLALNAQTPNARATQNVGATSVADGVMAPRHLESLSVGDGYRIGKLDVLEITVFKVPELSKTTQVAENGSVSYPLLGELPAAGKTAQELERDLKKLLMAKYLQKPEVAVSIKEYNSQRVLVDGSVVKPGLYPVQGKTSSLMQLVAVSGGLAPNADSTVVVFRTVDGKKTAAKFDVDDIRSGKIEDPSVRAGDVIVASNSAFKDGLDKVLKLIPVAGVFALL